LHERKNQLMIFTSLKGPLVMGSLKEVENLLYSSHYLKDTFFYLILTGKILLHGE